MIGTHARGRRGRKGFTLVEMLVALACGAILLTSLTVSAALIMRLNDREIEGSSLNYRLAEMTDAVRDSVKDVTDNEKFRYAADERCLYFEDRVILQGVTVSPHENFLTLDGKGFLYFEMSYTDAENQQKEYRFLVGTVGA